MSRLLDVMEDYLFCKQYKYLRLDGHTSGGDYGSLIDQFNEHGSPFSYSFLCNQHFVSIKLVDVKGKSVDQSKDQMRKMIVKNL